jgi:magnesium-transporting ATPase (P-type)
MIIMAVFLSLTTTGPAFTAAAVTDIKNKLLAKYRLFFSFVLTSFYYLLIFIYFFYLIFLRKLFPDLLLVGKSNIWSTVWLYINKASLII